jgi:hypothetical protein
MTRAKVVVVEVRRNDQISYIIIRRNTLTASCSHTLTIRNEPNEALPGRLQSFAGGVVIKFDFGDSIISEMLSEQPP